MGRCLPASAPDVESVRSELLSLLDRWGGISPDSVNVEDTDKANCQISLSCEASQNFTLTTSVRIIEHVLSQALERFTHEVHSIRATELGTRIDFVAETQRDKYLTGSIVTRAYSPGTATSNSPAAATAVPFLATVESEIMDRLSTSPEQGIWKSVWKLRSLRPDLTIGQQVEIARTATMGLNRQRLLDLWQGEWPEGPTEILSISGFNRIATDDLPWHDPYQAQLFVWLRPSEN